MRSVVGSYHMVEKIVLGLTNLFRLNLLLSIISLLLTSLRINSFFDFPIYLLENFFRLFILDAIKVINFYELFLNIIIIWLGMAELFSLVGFGENSVNFIENLQITINIVFNRRDILRLILVVTIDVRRVSIFSLSVNYFIIIQYSLQGIISFPSRIIVLDLWSTLHPLLGVRVDLLRMLLFLLENSIAFLCFRTFFHLFQLESVYAVRL